MRAYRYRGRRRKCPAWVIALAAVGVLLLAVLTAPAAGAVM